jgi:hypothetical protein
MRQLIRVIAVCLSLSFVTYGQGNTFNRVRYNGGSVDSKVDPKDWKNSLSVSSDLIILSLKDGKKLEITPKSVTSLSYGQEAHRRVGTMVALAILISPVALFGLLHKTRLHFIGIQYSDSANKSAGILLQGDKDNYRAMLVALQGVTGAAVTVSEKDREFVPIGVRAVVSSPAQEVAKTQSTAASESAAGVLSVSSDPSGADVSLDGNFVGNSPATLKPSPGKHTITITLVGYTDWSREISVQSGSEVPLKATLEKSN